MAIKISELGKAQPIGQLANFSPILSAGVPYVYDSSADYSRNNFTPLNVIIDATQATAAVVLTFQNLTYTVAAGEIRCLPLTGTPGQKYVVTGAGQVQLVFLNGPLPQFHIPGSAAQATQDTGIQSVLATSPVAGSEGLQTYSIVNATRSGAPSPIYAPSNYVSANQTIVGSANGDAFVLTNSDSPAQVALLSISITAVPTKAPTAAGAIQFGLTQQNQQSADIFAGAFYLSLSPAGGISKKVDFPGGLLLPAAANGIGLQMSQIDGTGTNAASMMYAIDFAYTSTLPA